MSAVDVHGLPSWADFWANRGDLAKLHDSKLFLAVWPWVEARESALRKNDEVLADARRALIEAAERRGYERGKQDALRQSESNLAEIIEAAERLAYKRGMQEALRQSGEAVLLTECCGREECGGECGNEWRGMRWYRKSKDDDTAPPATSGLVEALSKERDDGFSDGVILALQIMTSAGDMGSHDYHELLTAAGAVKVYKRAEVEGMLELSGLSEYVKMEGHRPADEFREALAAHDAGGGR